VTISTGDLAPAIRLYDGDGREVRTEDLLREGRLLLAFFKTTCPTCQLALPFLNRLPGAQVFAVSQDDRKRTNAFRADFGVETGQLYDPADGYEASNAFGITHVPSMFLIESDGRVSWSSVGFCKVELEALGAMLGCEVFTPADHVPAMKGG
jgi:peroxiredoxin